MTQIKFSNVGRAKRTWVAEFKTVDYSSMVKEIKAQKVLASKGIEIEWDGPGGAIYAGVRCVGTFEVLPTPAPKG